MRRTCDRAAALRRIAPAHSAISHTMRGIPIQTGVLFLLLTCSRLPLLQLSSRFFCIRPRRLSSNNRLCPQCKKSRGYRNTFQICYILSFSFLPGL